MSSAPEGIGNTMPAVQQDVYLAGVQAGFVAQARALQDSLLLNPILNQANSSIQDDQFKHNFNTVTLLPPRIFTKSSLTSDKLAALIDAAFEKEIKALPEPLQTALRTNIANNASDYQALEEFFAAEGDQAGYDALVVAHQATIEEMGQSAMTAEDDLSQLREMIYMYALLKVASTMPPTAATAPTEPIKVLPLMRDALEVLETTEKGVLAQMEAHPVGYGNYLSTVMGALRSAMVTLQSIQAEDAKVDFKFTEQIRALAAENLKEAKAAIAAEKAAEAERIRQAEEAKKQKELSMWIMIATIVVSVISIAVTLGTAAIAASAAAAAAAAGTAATAATTTATTVGGLTLGSWAMIAIDVAAIAVASVDYATDGSISNALQQGLVDMASGMGMSTEALSGVIMALAVLAFILTRGSAKINPLVKATSAASARISAKMAEKLSAKTMANLATMAEKTVVRTMAVNLAIPLLVMSGAIGSVASSLAMAFCPNDAEARSQAEIGITLALMLLTMGGIMGGGGALWRAGAKAASKIGTKIGVVGAAKGAAAAGEGALEAGAGAVAAGGRVGRGLAGAAGAIGDGVAAGAVGDGVAAGAEALEVAGGAASKAGRAVGGVNQAGEAVGADVAGEVAEAAGQASAQGAARSVPGQAADASQASRNAQAAAGPAAAKPGEVVDNAAAAAAAPAAQSASKAAGAAQSANVQVPGPVSQSVASSAASSAGKAATKTASTTDDALEIAKAELRNVDDQIDTTKSVLSTLKNQLKDAKAALKTLRESGASADEIAKAEETVNNITKHIGRVEAGLESLEAQKKTLQETIKLEQAKIMHAFETKQAWFQGATISLQASATLTQAGLNLWNYFITMNISEIEKLIAKYQSDTINKKALQAQIQALMDKLTADRETYWMFADDINTLMSQIGESGNALLAALQSGGRAIFRSG